jgi:PAS domain S-box-containing protein
MVPADDESLDVLWEDGERILCRGARPSPHGDQRAALFVLPAAEHPSPASLVSLAHEYDLKDELDGEWAARPLELVSERGRTMLALEDPGGEPLARLTGAPMAADAFLRLAIGIAGALGKAHQRGLVHKDLKPAHILVNCADGEVRLTGFGIASRLPRQRQALEPPETLSGTLAYMAPEQTGRMNRSIDSRSDLYSLGVTFYQMLTGVLPFAAADPMEWVHCHIARRPAFPGERVKTIPAPVSQIVMKLLAKAAEERYQTAAGLERDLRRCLPELEARGVIGAFPLGEHDATDRLLIPEKLYGRAREVEILLAAFDRIVKGGPPELMLVSGYSGIGKSTVVNELHKALVPSRGLFASGKFDQYQRDIPYSTVVQAFQSLVRPLLGRSDAELAIWRGAFLEALEPNARLMADLIPELKLIIGDQPPVPELEPQQAQSRFQLVFRRFIGVFARPDHPLALFLDDLQWLDAATLELIEDLLTRSELQYLMVIGAYRDNEVDGAHPLTRKLQTIRQAGAQVQEIRLEPLGRDDLGQLIADALHSESKRVAPLAQLVHDKTDGNPFFVIQFLQTLVEEGLLAYVHDTTRWRWNLDHIHTKSYTDNVVDLMVGKLSRLPVETQQALHQMACLGNTAEMSMLALVLETTEERIHAALWPAVRQELVERLEGRYRFIHDRVQEAAYSLIPEALRAEMHLRIGRLLAAQTPREEQEETIFEIVAQLNRGATLMTRQKERDQLAELNLIAGRRAKRSTAYASAIAYLEAGRSLLSEENWERNYELFFALEFHTAECELLIANMAAAENRLSMLAKRAKTVHHVAAVTRLLLTLYTTLDRSDRGVEVCLEYLRKSGVDWSPHPTKDEVRGEYERIWSQLGSRSIEQLVDLPMMSDPASLAALDVLTEVVTPALFTDENLPALVICRMVNVSLEHGNTDGSCFAYVWLGMIAGPHFENYDAGFQFGRLGYELVEKRGLHRFKARTYMSFGNLVMPWTRHVETGRELVRRAFDAANRIGDLTFAAYSCNNLNTNLLASGEPLNDAQREAENGLDFARKARFGLVIDIISAQVALIRTLRGLTSSFGSFNDRHFDESWYERHFANDPVLALPECWYWIRKLQARFFADDYTSAIEASLHAKQLIWTSPSFFEIAEYQFYSALSRAAICESAAADERQPHVEALVAHHRQLEIWAANCPENFDNRAALVGAEIARLEGRDADAMRLYEQAIRSSRSSGFVHNEAIAYERASAFYRQRGLDEFADLYLRNARYGYLRWGADGKVRQLEEMHPRLRAEGPAPGPTRTITEPVERLDLATVINVSQTVSGEMVLEKLIETLMRTAVEQAGAERGLLILPNGGEQRTAAEATTSSDAVLVEPRDAPVTASVLPETVLHYVLRTRESVILDDAAARSPFADDPYIQRRQARSILCLPLINQAKLIGVLYLENNLARRSFAPARIAVLKLIASQASISIENARLYRDLEQREAKIRGLVDANIIGIFVLNSEGQVLEANDAFLHMLGYDAEDLAAGRIYRGEITPPEWNERHPRTLAELDAFGTVQPFEKEYFRKDGSRIPVLVGGARFARDRVVAFVLDLTERKRAEVLLAGEKRILEMAARGDSLAQILESLCRLVEEQASGVLASILLLDGDRLRHGAAPSLPKAYTEAIDGGLIGPSAGSCGTAAYRGEQVIVEDIATDPLWADYREMALPHSLRACWSTPILSSQAAVIATFAMYYREPRRPTSRDQETIEQITHLAGIAIERNRTQEALRRSEAHLAEAQRLTRTGSWAYNALTRKTTYWSDELFRILELDPHEGPSREKFLRLVHPEDRDRVIKHLERGDHEKTGYIYDYRIVLADGAVRHLQDTGHPVFNDSGNLVEFVGMTFDATERKRAEEALREVQMELAHANRVATMGQLTASIAHEVNQPITAAVTNAHAALRWLNAEQPDLGEVGQALGRIAENGNRAAAVISRIRALINKAPPRKESVAINDAILEVVALARGEAAKNGVSVLTEFAEGLPAIEGDRVQLQQVILNLVVNAVDAMSGVNEAPRELLLSTGRADPGDVLIAVRDSGPGVAPEAFNRLFDAFYTTKADGMGMGLSICRSIVEAHGGRLWASANEPRGAVFQFTLPANPPAL